MLWVEVADCIATDYIRWSLAEMHSIRKLGARSDGCRTSLRQKLDSHVNRGAYLIDKEAGLPGEAAITPAIGVPSTEDEQAAMEAASDAVVVGGERPTIPSPNWALLFTIQVFMSIYTTPTPPLPPASAFTMPEIHGAVRFRATFLSAYSTPSSVDWRMTSGPPRNSSSHAFGLPTQTKTRPKKTLRACTTTGNHWSSKGTSSRVQSTTPDGIAWPADNPRPGSARYQQMNSARFRQPRAPDSNLILYI
jgi:hypothetical protein